VYDINGPTITSTTSISEDVLVSVVLSSRWKGRSGFQLPSTWKKEIGRQLLGTKNVGTRLNSS
jgi:hypothetical protein